MAGLYYYSPDSVFSSYFSCTGSFFLFSSSSNFFYYSVFSKGLKLPPAAPLELVNLDLYPSVPVPMVGFSSAALISSSFLRSLYSFKAFNFSSASSSFCYWTESCKGAVLSTFFYPPAPPNLMGPLLNSNYLEASSSYCYSAPSGLGYL